MVIRFKIPGGNKIKERRFKPDQFTPQILCKEEHTKVNESYIVLLVEMVKSVTSK